MIVSKPPRPPLVVCGHLHAIFLLVMKFHGECMSTRRDGLILMFPVTFESTVKLTPVEMICLSLIKNVKYSNVVIELLSRLSKIVSFQSMN